jgi:hypothetical protein
MDIPPDLCTSGVIENAQDPQAPRTRIFRIQRETQSTFRGRSEIAAPDLMILGGILSAIKRSAGNTRTNGFGNFRVRSNRFQSWKLLNKGSMPYLPAGLADTLWKSFLSKYLLTCPIQSGIFAIGRCDLRDLEYRQMSNGRA